MPPLGASFVNFAIWAAILYFGLRRPLSEFLQQRRALVVEGIEEAARVKAEAERKHKEYDERIKNMDAELERLRDELRKSGFEERDRIVADAAKRGEKMRAEAQFLIEQQLKQLREDLTKEAIDAAIRTAEGILRQGTSAADQERLANEYLGTLRSSLTQQLERSKQ
jgi:F-type H+-transporting ATPase subunit b